MKRVHIIEVGFGRTRWIYGAYFSRRIAERNFRNLPSIQGATFAELRTYTIPNRKRRVTTQDKEKP